MILNKLKNYIRNISILSIKEKISAKHIVFVSCIFIIFVAMLVSHFKKQTYIKTQLKQEEDVNKHLQKEEIMHKKIMSEPHTAMRWHIEEGESENAQESVAILVSHVINSGCKDAYGILLDNFDTESMRYLQDFVGGYSCGEFRTPPYVLQTQTDEYLEYKIKFNSRSQYLLKLNLDNDKRPKSFVIMYYATRDNILEENAAEFTTYDYDTNEESTEIFVESTSFN